MSVIERPELHAELGEQSSPYNAAEQTADSSFELDQQSKEAINSILVLGVAARYSEIDAILMGWNERRQIDGQPLQQVALDIVRNTTLAGLDRVAGDPYVPTASHSVYDRLFDYLPDQSHVDFVDRLSRLSDASFKLFYIKDYVLSDEEIADYRETQLYFMRAADQLFHDLFFSFATSDAYDIPERYGDFIAKTMEPHVAALYFDPRYIAGMMNFYREDRLQANESQELRFFRWMLKQAHHVKIKRLGEHTLAST